MNSLNNIFEKIKNKEPFALVRYGDGEKNILDNIPCERNGFSYDPGDTRDRKFQHELKRALQYNGGKNYFVGINNKELEKKIKGTIISPMIFVNQNYLEFLENLKNVTKEIPVILIVNKMAKLTEIPFNFIELYGLDDNAWRTAQYLDGDILEYLDRCKDQHLILVAGGAYSCTLIHKLWSKDRNHILLDVGSTLDPWLFGKNTRKYQERLKNDS